MGPYNDNCFIMARNIGTWLTRVNHYVTDPAKNQSPKVTPSSTGLMTDRDSAEKPSAMAVPSTSEKPVADSKR